MADLLVAAKPTIWRGRGEVPQLPWAVPYTGAVLVVELWAGIGGLVLACLALGVRVYVLSVEVADVPKRIVARSFPSAVQLDDTKDLDAGMLIPFLKKRCPSMILIGGGSPCQANSVLNTGRKGLDDERSHQPMYLAKFSKDVCDLPEVKELNTSVIVRAG